MRQAFSLLLLIIIGSAAAQQPDAWGRFSDTIINASGFKDRSGKIRVPPAYIIHADSFYNIVAVMDTGTYRSYYLLKNGKKIGYDSVFAIETVPDCESDGKIMFKDWKKDRVGFLDKDGKVVVPAVYNYAYPFNNGLTLALRNAISKCPDDDPHDCEHPSWVGGDIVMINDRNEVLADSVSFKYEDIDWYSLRINDPTIDTALYKTIETKDGDAYSFKKNHVEFERWFKNVFLPGLSSGGKDACQWIIPRVMKSVPGTGLVEISALNYFRENPEALDPSIFREEEMKAISLGQSFPDEIMLPAEIFRRYYTACNVWDRVRYPTYGVSISYFVPRKVPLTIEELQEYSYSTFEKKYERDYFLTYSFFRSEEGYKLYLITKATKDYRVYSFPTF